MMTVTQGQIMKLAAGSLEDPDCEVQTGALAEASTLGWAPGQWPTRFAEEFGDEGNVKFWDKVRACFHPVYGDLIAVDYEDADGLTLTVLND